jgi:hypothetical protein
MEPNEIDSMLMPGQVKQPFPKYFWITAFAPGLILIISPIIESFVTFLVSVVMVTSFEMSKAFTAKAPRSLRGALIHD